MSLVSEVAQHLHNQGIAQLATTLFYSHLPDASEDFVVSVMDTGGVKPDRYLPTHEPTFQVFIMAKDYDTGKAKLEQIRDALHQKSNTTLVPGGTYFYFIFAMAEGGHIGRNDRGMDEFSINFHCRHR